MTVSSEFYHRHRPVEGDSGAVPVGLATSDIKPMPIEPNRLSRLLTPLAYRKFKQRQYRIYEQFNTHIAKRSPLHETFAMAELPDSTPLQWSEIKADVVHLHWISFLADYPSFFQSIPADVPIVWTLHDMNPFTGGCHYADQCLQYRFGCGDCPQVTRPYRNDVSRATLEAKQSALAQRHLTIVSPSHWLKTQAQLSPVWPSKADFRVIPYGLDLHQFSPMNKLQARHELGLKSDAFLVGFGAADLATPRKGIKHLLNALRQLRNSSGGNSSCNVECILFGSGKLPDLDGLPPIHQLGFVDSIAHQRRIYSALDVVVLTSREDNQPQIGLEALACGTPVIGFASGGIPEFVRHGRTGLLVGLGNEAELASQIRRLITDTELRNQLGAEGRKMMQTEFEITKQSETYLGLYQSMLNQTRFKRSTRQAA
jgi:glycosyltransferase involved in cell wall biosynthesis